MAADRTKQALQGLVNYGTNLAKKAQEALDDVNTNGVSTTTQLLVIDMASQLGGANLVVNQANAAAAAEYGEA